MYEILKEQLIRDLGDLRALGLYKVVPKGKARIRVQLSAAHTRAQLEQAVAAFIRVGRELKVIV